MSWDLILKPSIGSVASTKRQSSTKMEWWPGLQQVPLRGAPVLNVGPALAERARCQTQP